MRVVETTQHHTPVEQGRSYTMIGHYATSWMTTGAMAIEATSDAQAMAKCRVLMKRNPPNADDETRETLDWCRRYGWTLRVEYSVGTGEPVQDR